MLVGMVHTANHNHRGFPHLPWFKPRGSNHVKQKQLRLYELWENGELEQLLHRALSSEMSVSTVRCT